MNSDEQIIALLSDKSTLRRGFEMLVAQYSERLYWQVRRFVTNHDDANDVVQNAFLKAWVNIGSFEGRSQLYTWLSRIAINEAFNFLRSSSKNDSSASSDDLNIANQLAADPYFDGDETMALLHEAVASLPEMQRKVFVLRYFEEMKYSAISEVLGVTEGSLKASFHIAVKKIEAYFNEHD